MFEEQLYKNNVHFSTQHAIIFQVMKMLLTSLGLRIKSIRENVGMSQIQLSEKTGIVREQISRIENGMINPTVETLHKLSIALQISLSDIFSFQIDSVHNYKKYQIKPFVKWAGGKTQIIDLIKQEMPLEYNTYYEPFVGGGALFFNLIPRNAVISDYNEELIHAYQCFQNTNDYSLMINEIMKHETNHSEEYYYIIRDMDRNKNYGELPKYIKAARMIYLNKACFNGLYRVNSKGYFNVPSGKKTTVTAYNCELFDNIHEFLSDKSIKIIHSDFEKTVQNARSGDFVYFDPPYDVYDEQNNFTAYSKENFGKNEQIRLASVFKNLTDRGVRVMLSNHNTPFINELYKEYKIKVIKAKRNINSKGDARGFVDEVIITNY